ncbi:AAA family ATPase [Pseudonocardia sp.]|uniref:AAA family ATPase n=1 Tax=Pseudonocardia sp. TaxID=60912 RepID=UPI003D0A2DB2
MGAGALFTDVDDAARRLAACGYFADDETAVSAFVAARLGKPLLVEGPAGVGKTELAKALARVADAELIRLQCYEGIDEARALYEWDYKKQLLRLQVNEGASFDELAGDVFGEEYLLERPLLRAIRASTAVVLLIDEVDKADVEVEALLLEVLSDFQVSIPELGTVRANGRPLVVLTSNATRELSEALRRRCLFLELDYPDPAREEAIVRSQVPEVEDVLCAQVVHAVRTLRRIELRKAPSIAETIDWTRTLLALGHRTLDAAALRSSLGSVLKHGSDRALAFTNLGLGSE